MNILLLLAAFLPAVMFNLVFFLIGFTPMLSGWISWGIINFAFLSAVFGSYPYWRTKDAARIGTQAVLAVGHLIAQVVVGSILIVISYFFNLKWVLPVLIHLFAGGVFIALAAINHAANLHTEAVQKKSSEAMYFSEALSEELRALWRSLPEGNCKKQLERAYDAARTMPQNPGAASAETDSSIKEALALLKDSAARNDMQAIEHYCNQLCLLIEKRK